MIQAGTIRIGSGRTVSVAGEYCNSSISSLRKTTWPGVMATSLPGVSGKGWRFATPAACRSAARFFAPARRFSPPARLGRGQNFRVEEQHVGGRDDVQHLPGHKPDNALMGFRQAGDVAGCVVPETFGTQKPLHREQGGTLLPAGTGNRRSPGSGSTVSVGRPSGWRQSAAASSAAWRQRSAWRPGWSAR